MLNNQEKPKPTEENLAILEKVHNTDDNLMIEAYAGCGKTTMLEMAVEGYPDPVLYLAFNKDVADEARERFPSTTEVRTFNSMGSRCWKNSCGKAQVDTKKIYNLLRETINEFKGDDRRELSDAYWDIVSAIGMSKHLGYIPERKFPHATRLIEWEGLEARLESPLSPLCRFVVDAILVNSIKIAYNGFIDFDDQIYMPALFGGSYPRFPFVLVDEDQDLSPTNHALLAHLAKGRVGAVGDRWQSIYYFRGAETNGVDKLKVKYSMTEMPLSVSFRCPKAIVEAQSRVPQLKWLKDGGHYEELHNLDAMDIPEGAAILCRNNAPLFKAAYGLLSKGRSVSVAGSDIGPKIIRLLQKVGNDRDTREDLLFKIKAWREEKLASTNAPATINDQADCMEIFASWGSTLDQAIAYANRIFKERGTIHLSTGHKAKGREWNTVYHLDPWLCGNSDQDLNLRYVITTRSAGELYEIDTRKIQWQ